jgi:hypothetical protein
VNFFAYTANNPVNLTDPIGTDSEQYPILQCHVVTHNDRVENAKGAAILISAAALPVLVEVGAGLTYIGDGLIIKYSEKLMPYINALFDEVTNFNPGVPTSFDLIKSGIKSVTEAGKAKSCPQTKGKTYECHRGK